MYLLQGNLSKHKNKFENTKFNNSFGLGISDILMNIMSCHGFLKSSILTVTLTYCSDQVSYDLSKGFFIVKIEEDGVNNIPMSVKIKTHADNVHQENSILTWKAAISSIINRLKNIIIKRYVYDTYVSNFYDDCNFEFYSLEFIVFV